MKALVRPEGVILGFLVASPAIMGGFNGSLGLNTVLLRLLLAVIGASLAVTVVSSIVQSYAAKTGSHAQTARTHDRRKSDARSATKAERPGG